MRFFSLLLLCGFLLFSGVLQAQSETITIDGQLTHGTRGFAVPDNVEVVLSYGNESDGVTQLSATTDAEGNFRFEDVPVHAEYEYVTFAGGSAIIFSSAVVAGEDLSAESDFSIMVYELTEDPLALSIVGIEILVQPLTVPDVGAGLVFEQIVTYENSTDRVFTTAQQTGDGRLLSILMDLPPGALIVEPDPNTLQISGSTTIADTRPVFPGTHELRTVYYLSYDDGAIVDVLFGYPIAGDFRIAITPAHLQIIHPELTLSEDTPGLYTGTINQTDGNLKYEIQGTVTLPESETISVVGDAASPLIPLMIIGVVVLLVMGAGLLLLRGDRNPDAKIERLRRQLHDLDTMHNAGQINHDVYRRQQQAIQVELDALLNASTEVKD